jgi:predicted dehydrogenase
VRAIRWGILGTGSISEDFCAGLAHAPACDVTAVASRTSDAFATRHKAAHVSTVEALAERADVDVIYIATPPALHREHAVKCLERGKAVLLEKPFATSAAEAREIVAAARKAKRFCMEAMWMRFVPTMRELLTALRDGKYGAVQSLEASLGFVSPYVRAPALLDLGVYPLSFAHAVLGSPRRVLASGTEKDVSAILEYPSAQAVVRASLRSLFRNDASVTTERALVHVEGPLYRPESYGVQELGEPKPPPSSGTAPPKSSPLRSLTQRPELRRLIQAARKAVGPRVTKPALGNGYAHEAIEVADCLRSGALESAILPLDESIAVMETVDAIAKALS